MLCHADKTKEEKKGKKVCHIINERKSEINGKSSMQKVFSSVFANKRRKKRHRSRKDGENSMIKAGLNAR